MKNIAGSLFGLALVAILVVGVMYPAQIKIAFGIAIVFFMLFMVVIVTSEESTGTERWTAASVMVFAIVAGSFILSVNFDTADARADRNAAEHARSEAGRIMDDVIARDENAPERDRLAKNWTIFATIANIGWFLSGLVSFLSVYLLKPGFKWKKALIISIVSVYAFAFISLIVAITIDSKIRILDVPGSTALLMVNLQNIFTYGLFLVFALWGLIKFLKASKEV
jgi:hypothetical protein